MSKKTQSKKPRVRTRQAAPTKQPQNVKKKPDFKRTKYEAQYDFSSSSTVPTTSILTKTGKVRPQVFYTPEVWDQMNYIIDACKDEVGWLGLVEKHGDDYVITEIFVPRQTVSGAETDIDAEAMAELAMELLDEGKDPSQLCYWGHSHVNMGVSPSGQDEEQVEEFLECPIFIRGIYNKKGDTKVDVYDTTEGLIHQCVNDGLYSPGLDEDDVAHLDKLLKANVKTRTPAYRGNMGMGGYGGYGGYGNTQPQQQQPAANQNIRSFPNLSSSVVDQYELPDDDPYAGLEDPILDEEDERELLSDPFYYKE